jgi:hypothetical protein
MFKLSGGAANNKHINNIIVCMFDSAPSSSAAHKTTSTYSLLSNLIQSKD